MDPELEKLARYKRATAAGKRYSNASRDFHRYVHRDDKVFPVKISKTRIPIKVKKPNKSGRRINKVEQVDYPFLALSTWMASIIPTCPQFFLGGNSLENPFGDMLEDYWAKYEMICPDHPIFLEKSLNERRATIPIALHGDEGRGLAHVPLLVISYQVIIPHNGPNALNIKKNLGICYLYQFSYIFQF